MEKTMFFASTFMCIGNITRSLFWGIWSCDQATQEAKTPSGAYLYTYHGAWDIGSKDGFLDIILIYVVYM